MEVYLIRHGIAAERGTYADDNLRPLIAKGKIKTEKVAQKLLSIGLKFDLILSSPLVRAYQTAEICQKAGLTAKIMTFKPLSPDGDIQEWLDWLSRQNNLNSDSKLGLVGHQPDLGNWGEMLVWGTMQEKLIVKKAGVIGLKLPEKGKILGNCELFLLTAPKYLNL